MTWQIEINGRVLPQRYETLEIALHKCRFTANAIVVRNHEPPGRSFKWTPAQRAAAHERALARRAERAVSQSPDAERKRYQRDEAWDQYWSAVKAAASA